MTDGPLQFHISNSRRLYDKAVFNGDAQCIPGTLHAYGTHSLFITTHDWKSPWILSAWHTKSTFSIMQEKKSWESGLIQKSLASVKGRFTGGGEMNWRPAATGIGTSWNPQQLKTQLGENSNVVQPLLLLSSRLGTIVTKLRWEWARSLWDLVD